MRIDQILNAQQLENISSQDIKKASKEFEAFFIYYLLKIMRQTIPDGGLMGHGISKEIYTSIMDEKIAEGIAERGGLGLSDFLTKNIPHIIENEKD